MADTGLGGLCRPSVAVLEVDWADQAELRVPAFLWGSGPELMEIFRVCAGPAAVCRRYRVQQVLCKRFGGVFHAVGGDTLSLVISSRLAARAAARSWSRSSSCSWESTSCCSSATMRC